MIEMPLLGVIGTPSLLLIACVLTAIAVGWGSATILHIIGRHGERLTESWQFELERKNRLRQGSWLYRWFEPWIEDLCGNPLLRAIGMYRRVQRNLDMGAGRLPWKADEFLAYSGFKAVLVAAAILWPMSSWFGVGGGIIVTAVVATLLVWRSSARLNHEARCRLDRFRSRLPYAIDLMALMMNAGASFRESLATVVRESHPHPLADELGKVLHEIERGQPLHGALDRLQNRMHDLDIRELVFAIQKADELGTPLSEAFLTLAENLRRKRSQWVEAAAGRAQANITFPGLVIMCACLLVILAPFVIDAGLHSPPLF